MNNCIKPKIVLYVGLHRMFHCVCCFMFNAEIHENSDDNRQIHAKCVSFCKISRNCAWKITRFSWFRELQHECTLWHVDWLNCIMTTSRNECACANLPIDCAPSDRAHFYTWLSESLGKCTCFLSQQSWFTYLWSVALIHPEITCMWPFITPI